jgi:hypothetical protein
MNYKINVFRKELNPNYAKEREEFQQKNRGRFYDEGNAEIPQQFISINALATEISEEQFNAIRKAVINNF